MTKNLPKNFQRIFDEELFIVQDFLQKYKITKAHQQV